MITADIAVCLGFRNWHLSHLDRCLRSLLSQQNYRFAEIALVDLGSEDGVLAEVVRIARRHGLSVLVAHRDEWSRSAALNLAAKSTNASRLLFTDADMIFPREYLARLHQPLPIQPEIIDRAALAPLGLTRSRDLPPPELLDSPLDGPWTEERLRHNTSPHPDVGMGAGMLVPRAWFERVGGFDRLLLEPSLQGFAQRAHRGRELADVGFALDAGFDVVPDFWIGHARFLLSGWKGKKRPQRDAAPGPGAAAAA
ncbi:MAG: glycosyltransferase family A protein [Dehalococcoidia bacterium]|nr:glycosyltransferase family A protein [Dehalococcoidia bacterium]